MPVVRLRRLRNNRPLREWVSQTQLSVKNFIMPCFVVEGKGIKKPIQSMPGIYHVSIDTLLGDINEIYHTGIRAILIFGIPSSKDAVGSASFAPRGVTQKAVQAVKKNFNDLMVITDVCMCAYTTHGHCGIIKKSKIGSQKPTSQILTGLIVDNDATLTILSKIALSHAEAGADFVAPSAMMDGQVKAIRDALDAHAFDDVGIIAYSAKYASSFYGPFRDALDSRPCFGDRKGYQMDYRNSDEALREIKQDIEEGADMVMVKPALAYLDIIQRVKQEFHIPLVAYNVSGEYSLIKEYSKNNKTTEKDLALEILVSIKRAGADFIISYWAKEIARWLE